MPPDTPPLLEHKRAYWFALDAYLDALLAHQYDEVFDRIDARKAEMFCFDGHTALETMEGQYCFFCQHPMP